MADINIAEIATLGARIAELGLKLKALKDERSALDEEIQHIETELRPLALDHAKLLAAIMGQALPAVASAPTSLLPTPGPNHTEEVANFPAVDMVVLKMKIKQYLTNAPPGVSALQIAEAIHADPTAVRYALRNLTGNGAPGRLEIDPAG